MVLIQAIDNEDGSRGTCIQLGWLNKDGELADTAPPEIRDLVNKLMVLVQAIDSENDSRRTCVQQGWLNNDGKLADTAPPVIQNLVNDLNEHNQQILDQITTRTAIHVIKMGMIKS